MTVDAVKLLGEALASPFLEEEQPEQKPIAIFVGRFQPFHKGHYSVYLKLVKQFGVDRTFIGTSNKVELPESPFTFEEKKMIMIAMFDIPPEMIVLTKSPYAPKEILDKFDPTTPVVVAVGEKDKDRLQGKYFDKLPEKGRLRGYEDKGYYVTAPDYKLKLNGKTLNGSLTRRVLGNGKISKKLKRRIFGTLYGKINNGIFDLIAKRSKSSERSRQKLDAIPNRKIINPETGREILLKTALHYDKGHPAYRVAKAEIR